MVYTGIIATEADIALMAGENVDATGHTEANRNLAIAQAEAYLCCLLRYDIVTNWASLEAIPKKLLTEWASRYCAVVFIAYNFESYGILEAENAISLHWVRMKQIEEIINQDVAKFIGANGED